MNGEDLVLEQVEIVVPPLAVQVGRVAVPARPDVGMVRCVEDGLDPRRKGRPSTVNFQPDDLAMVAREVAQFP